ncbi:DNA-3-methyladenine glycosylase [Candidatus Bathyarchaeota archaeon]|nr:DNA-3-methyladenine glycosylase [Candidatus Bathyarchaeota archaeon]
MSTVKGPASGRILDGRFYCRDPSLVALGLLGKQLVRRLDENLLGGLIVEVEAYYGAEDPASRAFRGLKSFNRMMWMEPGRAFIYNVHRYWMFNVVAHEPGEVGAVLVRAIEPLYGVDVMMKNRPVKNIRDLTSGPGRLSEALAIDKRLNGAYLTGEDSEIFILDNNLRMEVETSHRIGVRRDLEKELRFFVKGNPYISR